MITYQEEKFSDVIEELKPVLPLHYEELAMNKKYFTLDPDYNLYFLLEKNGTLNVVTARKDGEIVGYFWTFMRPHHHYKQNFVAEVDIYYVHPDHRGNGVGYNLFKFHEETMKKYGVMQIANVCKMHQDHTPLFESLGYNQVERVFTKIIKE